MAAGKVPLIFRLYKGDQFLREERLTLPVIKVGKLSSSHLRLDDESVSRMHAVIEVTGPGDISIIDLGSTKGTFVNGQKVNKAKLQAGDSIVVGDTRIDVAIGSEEAVAAPVEEELPTRVNPGMAEAAAAMKAPPAPPAFAPPGPSNTTPPPIRGMAPGGTTPPPIMGPGPGLRPPPGAPGYAAPFAAAVAPAAFQQLQAESIDDAGGARAVEVAAMMGDSVVSVKHVMHPRGGKITSATYGLLGMGALALLAGLVSFTISLNNATANKAAYDQWVNVEKAPAAYFRPEFISLAHDAIVIIGFVLGITLITAGLARLRREKESTPFFRIGNATEVEFPTSSAPAESFALVAPQGDDFVFNFVPGMEGELTLEGQSTSLAELQAQGRARPSSLAPGALEVAIAPKSRIRVKSGPNTFLISAVAQPRRQPTPLLAGMESQLLAYFGVTFAVVMGFVLGIGLIAGDPLVDDNQLDDSEAVAANLNNQQQDEPAPEEIIEEETNDSNEESGGTGTAMALDEGVMGKKDSDRAEGRYKMAKTQDQEQLARQQAIDAAATAGIMGSTLFQQGGSFSSITATGDISSGFDDVNIYGGLLGSEAGEMAGGFGFGRTGVGPGGGGTGWGTIGTGRFGTIGQGSGTGSGYGIGGGRGSGGGRSSAVPPVRVGEPTVGGDLDKEIIKRYIKRNLPKISYCYEKALLATPGLAGTVKTNFLIAANGTVQASNASGVSGEVSSCVAGVVGSIEFPKPKGGAGVKVNYPFIFRPTS